MGRTSPAAMRLTTCSGSLAMALGAAAAASAADAAMSRRRQPRRERRTRQDAMASVARARASCRACCELVLCCWIAQLVRSCRGRDYGRARRSAADDRLLRGSSRQLSRRDDGSGRRWRCVVQCSRADPEQNEPGLSELHLHSSSSSSRTFSSSSVPPSLPPAACLRPASMLPLLGRCAGPARSPPRARRALAEACSSLEVSSVVLKGRLEEVRAGEREQGGCVGLARIDRPSSGRWKPEDGTMWRVVQRSKSGCCPARRGRPTRFGLRLQSEQ